jgi:hypothetical protein
MIIKILNRHNASYSNLIEYIFKEGKTPNGDPHIITNNLRSDTKEGWVKEFLYNEANRKHIRKGQIYLTHEIQSFSNKDGKVSREILDDIAKKYISLRGREALVVAGIHEDKDHSHIHFCISGTKLHTGLSMRMSHAEMLKLKLDIQEYQREKYPTLEHSIVNHGSGREYLNHREYHVKKRGDKKLKREQLMEIVKDCFTKSKSQNEMLELLRAQNLNHYERAGKVTGIYADDKKYRLSTLGISNDMFNSLPIDRTEEDRALAEIRAIRKANESRERDRDDFHQR